MANDITKGKKSEGMGVGVGSKVNVFSDSSTNELGVPYGQTPGIGKGNRELSMNALTSNARVVKPASSNLMSGMSQSRGPGGAK